MTIILIAGALASLAGMIWFLNPTPQTSSKPPEPEPIKPVEPIAPIELVQPVKPSITVGSWIASHEAGHAVVAWMCSIVTEVNSITIEDKKEGGGGYVSFKAWTQHDSAGKKLNNDIAWCNIVILLAGMAGEVYALERSVRSGPARSDLESALVFARSITNTTPPWKVIEKSPTLPFNKMFTDISDREAAILRQCYAKARKLLEKHHLKYYRLLSALLTKPTMNELDVREILGYRTAVNSLRWNHLADFV